MESGTVARKSAKGTLFLGLRQVVVQGINFSGSILLARFLSVEDYGFFGVVSYLIAFLSSFSDIGLSTSLIRQTEEPTEREYKAVFTLQFMLFSIITIAFLLLSPAICDLYKLDKGSVYNLLLIGGAFFLSAFRVLPSVRLERNIDYTFLSFLEIAQCIVYNFSAVLLARWNFGAYSFSIAIVLRILVGVVVLNRVFPVRLGLLFDFTLIKPHLKFGLPAQGASLLTLLRDSISPAVIGIAVGLHGTGVTNMASLMATFPTMFLFSISRIYLPAFSKVRNRADEADLFVRTAIRINNVFASSLALFAFIMLDELIVIVFGSKWESAKPLFRYLWTANLFLPTLSVCFNVFYAWGMSKPVFVFQLLTMLITLGLGTPLILWKGILGFGIANVIVNFSSLVLFHYCSKTIPVGFVRETFRCWIPSLICAAALACMKPYLQPFTVVSLSAAFLIYSGILLPILFLFERTLIRDLRGLLLSDGRSEMV